MVKNFVQDGAAINVLAKLYQAKLEIVDVGVGSLHGLNIIHQKVALGAANFLHQPAMIKAQLQLALQTGKEAITRARANNTQLFIAGEMGITNTTSATAIACCLLDPKNDRRRYWIRLLGHSAQNQCHTAGTREA